MLSEYRGALRLLVHVQPGAKRNAIMGVHDGALKIAVSAPPVDGRANEAIATFIAGVFEVPARSVAVAAGHTSRRKTISIEGLAISEAQNRLDQLLTGKQATHQTISQSLNT